MKKAIALVKDKTNPFVGFNFFQYMIAYWKPCGDSDGFDKWLVKAWDNPKGTDFPTSIHCEERLFGTFQHGTIKLGKSGGIDYNSNNIYANQYLSRAERLPNTLLRH